jgi:hypothetical protein
MVITNLRRRPLLARTLRAPSAISRWHDIDSNSAPADWSSVEQLLVFACQSNSSMAGEILGENGATLVGNAGSSGHQSSLDISKEVASLTVIRPDGNDLPAGADRQRNFPWEDSARTRMNKPPAISSWN